MVTPRVAVSRQGQGGGRPRAPRAKVAEAVQLTRDEGITAEEAAERVGGLGSRTVRRAIADPTVLAPLSAPLPPATENDRKVDALIAGSRTWRRVGEALARFARKHPAVAGDLAAELRGVNL